MSPELLVGASLLLPLPGHASELLPGAELPLGRKLPLPLSEPLLPESLPLPDPLPLALPLELVDGLSELLSTSLDGGSMPLEPGSPLPLDVSPPDDVSPPPMDVSPPDEVSGPLDVKRGR